MSCSPISTRKHQPSPATTPTTPTDKQESFIEKIGTLGRKKKQKEGNNSMNLLLKLILFTFS